MGETLPIEVPGARWRPEATSFALHSHAADSVYVSVFDRQDSSRESRLVALEPRGGALWQADVEDVSPGQLYGFRVHGRWDPQHGEYCHPGRLLVDPLAAAVSGSPTWHESLGSLHPADTAPWVPKSVVVDPSFDWRDDQQPETPWSDAVIYECHVRGMTQLHPRIPPHLRGSYLGLCHEEVVNHLLDLGVTSVELLPVQQFLSEPHLHQLGLRNYFGYNPIAWLAPHADYASGDRGQQVREFKTMVRTLHAAGLEVLLDVVFNHTAEGNENGPTLCHRGVDNRSYYRLTGGGRHYENYSGCGNTIDFGQRLVVDTVIAALHYWVTEMHVDGFRFDLAPILGREEDGFSAKAAFFSAVERDPILSRVKLIAEPWDVGPDGYQLGRFPTPWREWNDRYRDAARAFWRGDRGLASELRQRLAGSSDLLTREDQEGSASLNYITSHDGFTLHDLVSYEHRHNWDNGEHNRDGHQHNLSRNWGCEGPTESIEINRLRRQTMRNFMASLAVSAGVPMLSHGDELARTQRGNNNAYCQDGPLTWVAWETEPWQDELRRFVRQAFAARRELGLGGSASGRWLDVNANEIGANRWGAVGHLPFAWLRRHATCHSLTVFNAGPEIHLFVLPEVSSGEPWQLLLDSSRSAGRRLRGHAVRVPARSLLLLTCKS
jgi:glycogen operon protein